MNVTVFFSGNIKERTGVAKVVKAFAENKQMFSKNGISHIQIKERPVGLIKPSVGGYHGLAGFFRLLMKKVIIKSYWGSKWFIENRIFRPSRSLVNAYFYEKQDDDILIFHDIFICYNYLIHCRQLSLLPKRIILVVHSNGELWKMIKIYYPMIVGKEYEHELDRRGEFCLSQASKVVFVAKIAGKNFQKLYPKYADKMSVVYNGIEQRPMCHEPVFDGRLRIVTVGTINERKNQIMQIEALARIVDDYDVMLTIIGAGECLEKCKKRANQLGVDDHIVFTGSRDDVPDLLDKCNLFVMSSYDEGLPIAAIEALRNKLPMILTNVGGNKELIDGNGILIDPNVDELVNAIRIVASSVEKQKEMSKNSYKLFLDHFSVESMIKGYSDLIKNVCNE